MDSKEETVINVRLSAIEKTLEKIERQLENKYVTSTEFDGLKTRVDKQEGNIVWIVRLLIGGIIAALLGLIINTSL